MLIKTKDFNYVEVSESDIIDFPQGIYAYEEVKRFVLLKNSENEWLHYLQSADNEQPRFILLDPYMFFQDYSPVFSSDTLELLKADNLNDISFFVVAVIPDDIKKSTVNLKSPVAINFSKHIGAQIILENRDYSVKTPLFI